MKPLILIKLGGSLITDKSKPYTVKKDILKNISNEIAEILKEKKYSLVVAHGGGSFPHTSAKKYETHKGIIHDKSWEGFVKVQNDAAKLNRIVIDYLINAGVNAVSVQPSASSRTKKSSLISWELESIKKMLDSDIIPVPYGDVSIDLEQGCSIVSTEELFLYICKKMKVEKIIMVGKHAVYTGDPDKDKKAELIENIDSKNVGKIKKYFSCSDGIDVTGGMVLKVEKALEMAKICKEVLIVSGLKKGNIEKAVSGKPVGTLVKW